MFTYMKIAARNIIKQKKRSLLLGIAIVIGTMIIVLTSSFSNGVGANIIRTGTALQTGHINVMGKWKDKGRIYDKLSQKEQIKRIIKSIAKDVDTIEERIITFARVFNPDREIGSQISFVHGVSVKRELRLQAALSIIKGNYRDLNKPGKVLIFKKLADKLRLDIGDTLTVKAKIYTKNFGHTTGTLDLQVAAIAKDMVGGQLHRVIAPLETLQKFYGYKQSIVSRLMVYLKNPQQAGAIGMRLRSKLKGQYQLINSDASNPVKIFRNLSDSSWKTGERISVTTFAEELQRQMTVKEVIDWISGLLIFVLAVVVFAGISNSLWMAIRERTSEIGTLRSIGMGRASILVMFMLEGLLIGFCASVIGAGLGTLLSMFLDAIGITSSSAMLSAFLYKGQFSFVASGAQFFSTIILAVIVTTIAGLLPAMRAAHMKPINAINHIG